MNPALVPARPSPPRPTLLCLYGTLAVAAVASTSTSMKKSRELYCEALHSYGYF